MYSILNSVYAYSSPSDTTYGKLVFRRDGSIYGYSNPIERYWDLDGDELRLFNDAKIVSRRFRRCENLNVWLGSAEGEKIPFCLSPVLAVDNKMVDSGGHGQSFLINSIPKAGTYFMEAALSDLEIQSVRLHLGGRDTVHDYRGLNDKEIHVRPGTVYIPCPVNLVAAILNGQQIVGHIEHRDVIDEIRKLNVCVVTLVRDLRDVLASLLRFKLDRVAPVGFIDEFWRHRDKRGRILGFLIHYHDRDLGHIRSMAKMIAGDSEAILLRYEQMCLGEISDEASSKLDSVWPGLSTHLGNALLMRKNHPNPTFSGIRTRWEDIWNDDIERYFQDSGMAACNRALGYKS